MLSRRAKTLSGQPEPTPRSQSPRAQVQLAALQATLDLLLLHSPAALLQVESAADADDWAAEAAAGGAPTAPEEDEYAEVVCTYLTPAFDAPSGPLRRTAMLGLCKLLHASALRSSSLLAKLLLTNFETSDADGAEKDDAEQLSQSLALFFAASGEACGVATAVLPAVRAVAGAAEGSRASAVSLDNLLTFLLRLTEPSAVATLGGAHVEIGLALACEAIVLVEDEDGAEEHKEVGSGQNTPPFSESAPPSLATPALDALSDDRVPSIPSCAFT